MKEYYEKECLRLELPGAHTIAYRALNRIKDAEKPQQWSINSLRPKLSDHQLANQLANFFSRITNEFVPINMTSLPVTYSNPIPALEPFAVAAKIKDGKKTEVNGLRRPLALSGWRVS